MPCRWLLTGMTLIVFLSTTVVTTQAETTDIGKLGDVHFATSCNTQAPMQFDRLDVAKTFRAQPQRWAYPRASSRWRQTGITSGFLT